jgi:hypothetical protein
MLLRDKIIIKKMQRRERRMACIKVKRGTQKADVDMLSWSRGLSRRNLIMNTSSFMV